jgi:hypothetical protein
LFFSYWFCDSAETNTYLIPCDAVQKKLLQNCHVASRARLHLREGKAATMPRYIAARADERAMSCAEKSARYNHFLQ